MKVHKAISEIEKVFLGKKHIVEYSLACFFAKGHLLLEDIPGVGKTTLALSIAKVLGLEFRRVQFTSDLMPSDITGSSIYNRQKGEFIFKKGPIFTNVFLADEINRASPKTQSALLEAMAEKQVTADGVTYRLPEPFFVIATQNPVEQYGTFPLPESQKDRFTIKLSIGYPERDIEREILKGEDPLKRVKVMNPVIEKEHLAKLLNEVENCYISGEVIEYILDIVKYSREHPSIITGVSTRGARHLLNVSKALAYIRNRDFVIPDDVRELAKFALSHRIVVREGENAEVIMEDIINSVKAPA